MRFTDSERIFLRIVAEKHTILYLCRVRARVSGCSVNFFLQATVQINLLGVQTPPPPSRPDTPTLTLVW